MHAVDQGIKQESSRPNIENSSGAEMQRDPIATNGFLDIDSQGDFEGSTDSQPLRVRIQQIQIEQDTAKTTRLNDGSVFVDLNRAGSGLMEIVTEADMRSPAQAAAFVKKLQAILRRLNASDGDMEKGSLRVDANVSIHRAGTPFGTRCEIKNLNSVRFMQQALDYERRRHVAHYLAHPETAIRQETRGFNESLGKTHTLRTKEDAEDYRYMPDPNLAPMVIADVYLDRLATDLPELPGAARHRLAAEYGITHTDVDTLLSLDEFNGQGIQYFEAVVKGTSSTDKHLDGKKAVNWITHELLGRLAQREESWDAQRFPAQYLRELLCMTENGDITGSSAKNLLKHILEQNNASGQLDIGSIAKDLGLLAQGSDELEELCKAVIQKLPKEVESIRKGKVNVVMRLVGEVMKDSRGTADARKAKDILLGLIEQNKP
ncbi:hypothetical protein QFC21_001671 [Naganishia friedmannii]|uniref:Uncharacterized protein n=1 Tax=Naganishia friedmannii TaxID=89922 RepID=A0ACC2W1Q7_9TREE|nr:hypothetical protein QFC21_001671 [Naganishia friedmannii]